MNKEQLLEDVKFPLKWDTDVYKMYIFDSVNKMIAQVDSYLDATEKEHPFEKLIGDYKDVGENPNPKYTLYKGDFYNVFKNAGDPIGMVRGWGRLQYKENPEERQDNMAEYILNIINS